MGSGAPGLLEGPCLANGGGGGGAFGLRGVTLAKSYLDSSLYINYLVALTPILHETPVATAWSGICFFLLSIVMVKPEPPRPLSLGESILHVLSCAAYRCYLA